MKLIRQIILILIVISIKQYSQTIIPSGEVSGLWTAVSSPYLINGEITIPKDSTLSIEAGVIVEFQGHYKFNVQGQLLAVGTETDSITFTINDTTGFSNPNIANGGWFGIRFFVTPYNNDTSKIYYCKLQYGKAIGDVPGIPHADNLGGAIFISYFDKVVISNCLITNNYASNAGGGIAIVHCSPKIINNTIAYNKSESGGGIELREESNPVIENNMIMNNQANSGGGINCLGAYNLRISNTVVKNNIANDVGGGISCFFAGLNLNNVILSENKAGSVGGGIGTWRSNLFIDSSTINNNEAFESGSGVFFNSGDTLTFTYQLHITNSNFTNNKTTNSYSALIAQQSDSARINVVVSKCLFTENKGPYMSVARFVGKYLNFNFNRNIISNNEAKTQASCIMFTRCKGKVSNCLFSSNQVDSAGIGCIIVWDGAEVEFMNNTVVDNLASYGTGLLVGYGGKTFVTNSIIWGDSTSQIILYTNGGRGGTAIVNHCDIRGGENAISIPDTLSLLNWGNNNIDKDPLFVDQLNGDYHLQNISPCIGAAIDTLIIDNFIYCCPSTDIEENLRPNPLGTLPDIGAYESLFANPVEVNKEIENIINEFCLLQNFPNPFNSNTIISYSVPYKSNVQVKVYNLLGQLIQSLVNEEKTVGTYEVIFDASSVASGIYFYQLTATDPLTSSGQILIQIKKMILLK